MKITEKHRIKYKLKEAPGEPVEMSIYRDDDGDYISTTGDIVAYVDGTPSWWVKEIQAGTSKHLEGEIISPPLEPKLGRVIKHVQESGHIICFTENRGVEAPWVDEFGDTYSTEDVVLLMDEGWEEVSCGN